MPSCILIGIIKQETLSLALALLHARASCLSLSRLLSLCPSLYTERVPVPRHRITTVPQSSADAATVACPVCKCNLLADPLHFKFQNLAMRCGLIDLLHMYAHKDDFRSVLGFIPAKKNCSYR